MEHSKEITAAALPEPPDGARLVVDLGDDELRVIWRDDTEAAHWRGQPGEHWFHDSASDPMELHQHLKYAHAVYVLDNPIRLH